MSLTHTQSIDVLNTKLKETVDTTIVTYLGVAPTVYWHNLTYPDNMQRDTRYIKTRVNEISDNIRTLCNNVTGADKRHYLVKGLYSMHLYFPLNNEEVQKLDYTCELLRNAFKDLGATMLARSTVIGESPVTEMFLRKNVIVEYEYDNII